jgi:hypothetical protein
VVYRNSLSKAEELNGIATGDRDDTSELYMCPSNPEAPATASNSGGNQYFENAPGFLSFRTASLPLFARGAGSSIPGGWSCGSGVGMKNWQPTARRLPFRYNLQRMHQQADIGPRKRRPSSLLELHVLLAALLELCGPVQGDVFALPETSIE